MCQINRQGVRCSPFNSVFFCRPFDNGIGSWLVNTRVEWDDTEHSQQVYVYCRIQSVLHITFNILPLMLPSVGGIIPGQCFRRLVCILHL